LFARRLSLPNGDPRTDPPRRMARCVRNCHSRRPSLRRRLIFVRCSPIDVAFLNERGLADGGAELWRLSVPVSPTIPKRRSTAPMRERGRTCESQCEN
jgi:hypothetical protein